MQTQPNQPESNHNFGFFAIEVGNNKLSLSFLRIGIEFDQKIENLWFCYVECLYKHNKIDVVKQILVDSNKINISKKKMKNFDEQLLHYLSLTKKIT